MVKMGPNGELLLRILLEFDININNDITILHAYRLKYIFSMILELIICFPLWLKWNQMENFF